MPELLRTLHELVQSNFNAFFWHDAHHRLCNLYSEIAVLYQQIACLGPGPALAAPMLPLVPVAGEGGPGSPKTTQILERRGHAVLIAAAGEYSILQARLQQQEGGLGTLNLYRKSRLAPFTRRDAELIADILPYAAKSLQARPGGHELDWVDSGQSGMIVCEPDGRIRFICPQGQKLLYLAMHADTQSVPPSMPDNFFTLPSLAPLFRGWRQQLSDPGLPMPIPMARHHNAWGGFVFRAYWLPGSRLDDSSLVGIMVHFQEPQQLQWLRAVKRLPLSLKQKEVCLLLARGCSKGEIAEFLHVSVHTAVDHIRKIYGKLDIHNRVELLRKLGASVASQTSRGSAGGAASLPEPVQI
ncbi:helix-turn-helix transcriptional regulator [Thermithiobacillus tepidarius DSM 3134]|uniref:helix-turn-helix transcriptional regulator n=1 Tax=Thermithiobacillus tepidarius TaxID=929 RepID=UPI00041BBAD7|nr:helix-turn-helix transcriptional regulator [Thermithiobacillus tepidarius]